MEWWKYSLHHINFSVKGKYQVKYYLITIQEFKWNGIFSILADVIWLNPHLEDTYRVCLSKPLSSIFEYQTCCGKICAISDITHWFVTWQIDCELTEIEIPFLAISGCMIVMIVLDEKDMKSIDIHDTRQFFNFHIYCILEKIT